VANRPKPGRPGPCEVGYENAQSAAIARPCPDLLTGWESVRSHQRVSRVNSYCVTFPQNRDPVRSNSARMGTTAFQSAVSIQASVP